MENKKNKTAHYLVGTIILILVATGVWYYFSSKKKPTVLSPAPGKTPVPSPKGTTPVVNTTNTTPTLFAVANSPLTVYNADFSKYYDANSGDVLGAVVGTDGDWTIIVSAATGTNKYVYTQAVTIS